MQIGKPLASFFTCPVNALVKQHSVKSKWPVIKKRGIAIRSFAVFCNVSGLIEKFTSLLGDFGMGYKIEKYHFVS